MQIKIENIEIYIFCDERIDIRLIYYVRSTEYFAGKELHNCSSKKVSSIENLPKHTFVQTIQVEVQSLNLHHYGYIEISSK